MRPSLPITMLATLLALSMAACGSGSAEREAESPQATPEAKQTRATNCMPDPSACGYPDIETVGVSPGTQLAPVSGVVTLDDPGEVLENKQVTGSIIVTAPNVTIRNVRLVVSDPYYGILIRRGADANLVVERSEIDMNGKLGIKGIAFDGYTLRKVLMRNGADCAHFNENVVIEDSLCTVGVDADRDASPDGGARSASCQTGEHLDGFQLGGGENIVIRHNTLRNPCAQTSAILISHDPGYNAPIRDITVSDNLMAGGGYTLYCSDANDTIQSETVTGNRFARTYFPSGGRYGRWAYCEHATTFSGNVWDDSAPVSAPGRERGTGAPAASPRLALVRARGVTRAALKQELGRRFTRRTGKLRVGCDRRSRLVVACAVRWNRRDGRVRHRYKGSVRVRRVAAGAWRYRVRIRSWSSGCRCGKLVTRTGTLRA